MPRTSALRIAFLPMQTLPTRDGESHAFMVPSSFSKNTIISPRSALARSDDKNVIILFSASAGLLFAKSTKASGDLASLLFRKPISLLS
jgi:hypothetical protein